MTHDGFFRGKILIALMPVLVVSMGRIDSFAASASYENIQKLQKEEFIPVPEQIERPVFEYTSGDLRDPFQLSKGEENRGAQEGSGSQYGKVQKSLPPLKIQGVIWGGIFPQAIIENKVVRQGDTITVGQETEEIKIISIDKEGIVVYFDEQNYKLPAPAGGGASTRIPSGG